MCYYIFNSSHRSRFYRHVIGTTRQQCDAPVSRWKEIKFGYQMLPACGRFKESFQFITSDSHNSRSGQYRIR